MKLLPLLVPRARSCPCSRRGFSLVEVLVVVSVMSILTVLTVSSVSALRATSLTASGNQIVDVFAMARQNSISKNAITAVVIKSQGIGAYQAYCLLSMSRGEDGVFGPWTTVTPWHYLPQGIVFESGQSRDTFMSSGVSLPQALPTSFPFQGQQINLASSSVYQCYQADGTLLGGQSPPVRLRLAQGVVDASSGTFIYRGASVAGQQVSYYDLVFVANTGVTKIERP